MPRETLDLAHEVIDAVEHRDLARLLDLTDPDVDWRSAFAVGGQYRGHEGIRKYVNDMNDAWETVRLDVDYEFGIEDLVLFIGRIHYRGKGSGVEAESQSGYLLKFRDGKVVCFRPFKDPVKALERVGLPD